MQAHWWLTKSGIKSTCINIILPFSFETCKYLWPIWQKSIDCVVGTDQESSWCRCKCGMAKNVYPVYGDCLIFVSEAAQWGSEEGCPSQVQHILSSAEVWGNSCAVCQQCPVHCWWKGSPRAQPCAYPSAAAMVVEPCPGSSVTVSHTGVAKGHIYILYISCVAFNTSMGSVTSFVLLHSRVTGGELFEDIVAREYYSEADAR